MSTVYVLNKDGKPLMPTTRGGHVRHLLKEQKARIAGSKDGKATTYKDSNANSITASKCKFVAKNSGILFV